MIVLYCGCDYFVMHVVLNFDLFLFFCVFLSGMMMIIQIRPSINFYLAAAAVDFKIGLMSVNSMSPAPPRESNVSTKPGMSSSRGARGAEGGAAAGALNADLTSSQHEALSFVPSPLVMRQALSTAMMICCFSCDASGKDKALMRRSLSLTPSSIAFSSLAFSSPNSVCNQIENIVQV